MRSFQCGVWELSLSFLVVIYLGEFCSDILIDYLSLQVVLLGISGLFAVTHMRDKLMCLVMCDL